MNKYLDFCNRCMQGKLGYSKGFYIIDKVETPKNKEIADAEIELEQEKTINKAKKRKYNQSGGVSRGLKRNIKKILKIKKELKKENSKEKDLKRKGG